MHGLVYVKWVLRNPTPEKEVAQITVWGCLVGTVAIGIQGKQFCHKIPFYAKKINKIHEGVLINPPSEMEVG